MDFKMQDRLFSDLKQATKKGDKTRQSVIRLARAEIQNAEKAKGKPLDDPGVIEIISKEAKKRRESITEFRKADRQDLLAQEEAELAILLEYLPPQMSREEIVAAARNVIEELGAQGPGDKGRVMGKLMPQLKGRAEGSLASEVVSELLASS
jgi:uncharacterized protein YqeY